MWAAFWDWLANLPQGSGSFVGSFAGSAIGLIAILLGALFNSRLNRKRDDKLREEDRVALASTLYAELQGIHRALIENAQHLKEKVPDPDGGFLVPQPPMKLLPGTLPKMGLLPSETIRKVMDAYLITEQYLGHLILIGGIIRPDMPGNRQLVYLDAKHATFVTEFNRTRASVVKEAMNAILPYLK